MRFWYWLTPKTITLMNAIQPTISSAPRTMPVIARPRPWVPSRFVRRRPRMPSTSGTIARPRIAVTSAAIETPSVRRAGGGAYWPGAYGADP
jgi:hypothetical protein